MSETRNSCQRMCSLPMMDSRSRTNNFLVLAIITVVMSVTGIGQKPAVRDRDPVKINKKGDITNRAIRKNRARFHYDDGGKFSCALALYWIKVKDNDPCKENRVRDYIWEHVNSKKRGYIRAIYIAVDTGSVEHIFVEPDDKGN